MRSAATRRAGTLRPTAFHATTLCSATLRPAALRPANTNLLAGTHAKLGITQRANPLLAGTQPAEAQLAETQFTGVRCGISRPADDDATRGLLRSHSGRGSF